MSMYEGLYREKMRAIGVSIMRGIDDQLWSDAPVEPWDPGYIENDPRYVGDDPRRRVCKEHDESFVDCGTYSVCPKCRWG